MATVLCNGCGWTGTPDEADACMSAYHDMRCPKCGTTNLDTSDVLREDPAYGYGADNFLEMRPKGDAR